MQRGLRALLGLLWVQLCWVRGQQVEQSPSALRLQEGASSTLRCNFSTTIYSVQWFRQNPGGGLINLIYLASGTKQEGRLKATADAKERYSTLHISTSQLEDSGTYLCAVEAQCSQGICSLSPNYSCTCSHSLCLTAGNRRILIAIIPVVLILFSQNPFDGKISNKEALGATDKNVRAPNTVKTGPLAELINGF
uniref:Ig-like domain-containing protein n=1 Tax=Marmota marmota marmota TaxID=9994 RepID=A0A8C6EUH5_MARMA